VFEDKDDSLSFSFFRISFGVFLLIHFISIINDFDLFYSSKGIVPDDVLEVYRRDYFFSIPEIARFFNEPFSISEASFILFFKITYLTLCVSFILGCFTRLTALLLVIMHLIMIKGAPFFSYGVDAFASIALTYSFLFPLGKTSLIDRKFFNYQNNNFTPYRRVLQIHMSIVYFVSGVDKIAGYNWRNGEAIWKSIHLPFFNIDMQDSFSQIGHYPLVFVIMGWGVILLELLYPIFIWNNKTRGYWLFMILAMHVGIAMVLNLFFFSALMMILNITAFYNFRDFKK
jgi:hypothetical protein